MRHFLYFLGLTCLFYGCGNGGHSNSAMNTDEAGAPVAAQEAPDKERSPATPDTASFTDAFSRFFKALQASDTAALNSFADTQQGFWLIEQPGAVPSYTHYTSVQDVKRQHPQRSFVSINKEVAQCRLQQRQTFPEFDCADMDGVATGYAEDGCFYSFNTSEFRNTNMWQYASLSEQQAEQVQELQQQVDATVLHTRSSFRFHFGYRNGRWQLLFADLRVPCSA